MSVMRKAVSTSRRQFLNQCTQAAFLFLSRPSEREPQSVVPMKTRYGETEPVPLTFESILIKLRTGSVERRRDEYDPKATLFAEALKDHILIGTRGTRLVQVEWPSFREILGVDVGEPRFIHLSA